MNSILEVVINPKLSSDAVPNLRESVGWGRREYEYPILFEKCFFYAGILNEKGELIAFGYIVSMGLEHGYLEDVMVHPSYQRQGLGTKLVKAILNEAKQRGLLIITVSFDEENKSFYQKCGFEVGYSGTIIY